MAHAPIGAAGAGGTVVDGHVGRELPCNRCGYELRGLPVEGACPECGAPVIESLRGRLLRYSAPEYVGTLYTGVSLIVWSIIAQVVLRIVGIVGSVLLALGSPGAAAPARSMQFAAITGLASTGLAILLAVGWWRFSTPDPASRDAEQGEKARRIVRIAIAANLAVTLTSAMAELVWGSGTPAGGRVMGPAMVGAAMSGLIMLLSLAATAAQFFASMIYIIWLAPRIPDREAGERAHRYMWLLPILTTVGAILFMIGPLLALVLYWLLLDQIRRDLRDIRKEQAFAAAVAAEAGITPRVRT